MRVLTLFHTAESNVALFEGLFGELAPEIPLRHVMGTKLLERAMDACGITPEIEADTRQAILDAIGPETKLLVCTCSTIGGCADRTAHAGVPILRIDRPMAEQAVAAGKKILVAACLDSTVGPTTALVRDAAGSREVEIQTLLIADAWPKFKAGDKAGYWADIAAALRREARGFDAVVLAQASMAGAAELCCELGIPVLASPRIGAEAVVKAWRSMGA